MIECKVRSVSVLSVQVHRVSVLSAQGCDALRHAISPQMAIDTWPHMATYGHCSGHARFCKCPESLACPDAPRAPGENHRGRAHDLCVRKSMERANLNDGTLHAHAHRQACAHDPCAKCVGMWGNP